jgi:hypothetical protein
LGDLGGRVSVLCEVVAHLVHLQTVEQAHRARAFRLEQRPEARRRLGAFGCVPAGIEPQARFLGGPRHVALGQALRDHAFGIQPAQHGRVVLDQRLVRPAVRADLHQRREGEGSRVLARQLAALVVHQRGMLGDELRIVHLRLDIGDGAFQQARVAQRVAHRDVAAHVELAECDQLGTLLIGRGDGVLAALHVAADGL